MKKAVIITENKYPEGDAGAVRQHAFAKMFMELDFSVIVMGYGESTQKKFREYEGVRYISFRSKAKNRFFRLVNRIIFGFQIIVCLKQNACEANVIMVVDTLPYAFKLVKKFADNRGILLIHDSVEWYSPEEYPDGEKNIQYRLKEKTNRFIVGEGWRVVAISKYLQRHFLKMSDKVVRIPVVMDVSHMPYSSHTNNEKIKFVYAGTPGLKDHLREIITGFSLLPRDQIQQVELCVFGVSKQQLYDECGVDSRVMQIMQESLRVYGRIPREQVIKEVMSADYTVLLRSAELRYAQAGFPTKVVESLACGTPPMCNLSSDLGDYLKDGENSVIIEGQTPVDVRNAVLKALSYKAGEVNLRSKARKTAEECFDYRQYTNSLKYILSD